MIFARRALQSRLDLLRDPLGDDAVNQLAKRLNRPGKDRLAAMWEVVVIHALTKCGEIRHEDTLPTGKHPDIFFKNGSIQFIADITAITDETLDDTNPFYELFQQIEKVKNKLGLPVGGLDVRAQSRRHESSRGVRTVLRLPPSNRLETFVRDQITPQLREQIAAGDKILRVAINDDEVGLVVTIDPSASPYSTGSHATYDVPTIKDQNPLYNALKAKADQLRGASGTTGVIICDGDCAALVPRADDWRGISAESIAREFLRQYSSVDFVLFLTIREEAKQRAKSLGLIVYSSLVYRAKCEVQSELNIVFNAMLAELPKPVELPVNGALRARETGYDLGHHGGSQMTSSSIRISARELLEVLAGLRSLEDDGARNVGSNGKRQNNPISTQNAFQRKLKEGRLPVAIDVIKTDQDDNDDWVEFKFGDPDPAISQFK